MNSVFHRAQHWHLFILTFGVMFFAVIIMFAFMISQMSFAVQTQRVPDLGYLIIILGIVSFFVVFVQLGWMWSIGDGMKHLLPKSIGMNDTLFKLFFLVIILYQLYNLYLMYEMISVFSDLASGRNPATFLWRIMSFQRYTLMFLPLTLFVLFCQCYLFYYCAKTLKSIELNREADVGDYIGLFFLFMFNVVGFWIIQPKINRIMYGDWTPPPSGALEHDSNSPFDPVYPKEVHPRGDLLKTKDHEAFEHDDDFEGLF
jgi:hypothetical protein